MEGCSKDALSSRRLRGRGPSLQYLLGPLSHSCGGWGGRADGYAVEGSDRYQSYPGVPYLGPAMLSLSTGVEHVTLKCRQRWASRLTWEMREPLSRVSAPGPSVLSEGTCPIVLQAPLLLAGLSILHRISPILYPHPQFFKTFCILVVRI